LIRISRLEHFVVSSVFLRQRISSALFGGDSGIERYLLSDRALQGLRGLENIRVKVKRFTNRS